jgi:hypothetical protein
MTEQAPDPMRELTEAVRELTAVMTDSRRREDAARAEHGGLGEPHEVTVDPPTRVGGPEAAEPEAGPVAPIGIPDLIRYWRDDAAEWEARGSEPVVNPTAAIAEHLRMCADMAEAVLAGQPGAYSCTECGWISQPEYWHWTDDHDTVAGPGEPAEGEADYSIDDVRGPQ